MFNQMTTLPEIFFRFFVSKSPNDFRRMCREDDADGPRRHYIFQCPQKTKAPIRMKVKLQFINRNKSTSCHVHGNTNEDLKKRTLSMTQLVKAVQPSCSVLLYSWQQGAPTDLIEGFHLVLVSQDRLLYKRLQVVISAVIQPVSPKHQICERSSPLGSVILEHLQWSISQVRGWNNCLFPKRWSNYATSSREEQHGR